MSLDPPTPEPETELRQLTPDDYGAWRALVTLCFPTLTPWSKAQFESMIARFPEGQICVVLDGAIVASSASLIVDYSDYSDWHDYLEISDQGYIRNHDPQGDTLYGIETMVHPDHRGRKLAHRLYDARKDLCRDLNCARQILGGRIPGYAMYRERMSAHEYVAKVIDREIDDPVLTPQLASGFQLRQIVKDEAPNAAATPNAAAVSLETTNLEDKGGWATTLEWPNLAYVPRSRQRRARRSVLSVRLSLVQYEMRSIADFREFERQCEFYVDTAADYRADFLCFPELFTVQLLSTLGAPVPTAPSAEALLDSSVTALETQADARRLAALTPRYVALFSRLATRYRINIIGGSQFETDESGRHVHNVGFFFGRDGTVGRQKKIHVTPNESRYWGVTGGDRVEVFDTDFGRIAVLVCYDCEFPELARVAVAKGARILFVPYNTNDRQGHLRVRICAHARAIENQVYVVTAGCVGNLPLVENADTHYAQSGVFTPSDIAFARDGIAVEAEPNVEAVLFQDVDLELLRRARRNGTVQNWNDRRTDLYRVVFKDGSDELVVD